MKRKFQSLMVHHEPDDSTVLCSYCGFLCNVEDIDADGLCESCHINKHGFRFSFRIIHKCVCAFPSHRYTVTEYSEQGDIVAEAKFCRNCDKPYSIGTSPFNPWGKS